MNSIHVNITEADINKICRICLKNELLHSIYNTNITFNLSLRSVINYLSFFKTDTETQLPSTLCQSCVYRLLDAYNLKQQCETSESKLKHYIQTTTTQYPYMSSKSYSTLFNMSTVTDLSAQSTGHFTTSPIIHHPSSILPTEIKRQDCEIFDSMHCDIFGETQNSEDIEVTDDVLNDVEIDVSSLTRSDFNDDVIQQSANLNNNFSSNGNKFGDRIDPNVTEFNKNLVKDNSMKNVNNKISATFCQKSIENENANEICLKVELTSGVQERVTKQTKKSTKKIFECNECSKVLKTLSHYEAHRRIHFGIRPYKCKRCPKSFTQIGNFNSHMNNVHLERRQYQCEICSKLFTTSSNLKQHKVTHINEKHFICTMTSDCKKQFRSNNELKNHQKVHSNVKNYHCSDCNKRFLKKSYLNLHHRIVHKGEKPYKCKQCLKEFSRSSNLIAHERIHTGIKPFLCKLCNSKFNQASALSRHAKACHSSNEKKSCSTEVNFVLNQSGIESKESTGQIMYTGSENLVNEIACRNEVENVSQFSSYTQPQAIQRNFNSYQFSKSTSKFYD